MVKLTALYPNEPDAVFNFVYYTSDHQRLVDEKLEPYGLVRTDVDRGMSGVGGDGSAPFIAVGHLFFESLEGLQQALEAHGEELLADVPNFSYVEPRLQISQVVQG